MRSHLIYLAVIVLLLIVIGFNRCGDNIEQPIVVTTIDSTVVDSLTSRIDSLQSIPPDTVEVKIPISDPDQTKVIEDDTVNVYTNHYSDSLITARWELGLTGSLKYQNFEYIPKATPVIRETVTKYITQYRNTTETITRRSGGFVAIGGDVGYSQLTNSLGTIQLRYQAKDGYSYHYRYDPFLQGHYIGLTIPIRIKIPFL